MNDSKVGSTFGEIVIGQEATNKNFDFLAFEWCTGKYKTDISCTIYQDMSVLYFPILFKNHVLYQLMKNKSFVRIKLQSNLFLCTF